MAYVLGFLYADGNITNSIPSRTQYIHLYSNDEHILYAIKAVLSSSHGIQKVSNKTFARTGKTYKSKDGFRLRIGSKEMYSDLLKLGVVPNKSRIATFPNIPKKYLGSFIRGNFDGDGCVFLQKALGITQPVIIKKLSAIFTSGSYKFLEGMVGVIKNNLTISHNRIYNGTRSFQLRYSTKDSIELFKLMYQDCRSGLYLKRKSDIFNDYFRRAPKKIDKSIHKILENINYGSVLK